MAQLKLDTPSKGLSWAVNHLSLKGAFTIVVMRREHCWCTFTDRLTSLRARIFLNFTCEHALRGVLGKCSCTLLPASMICRKVCSKIHADRNKLVLRSVLTCCVRADFSALAESYYLKRAWWEVCHVSPSVLHLRMPYVAECFTNKVMLFRVVCCWCQTTELKLLRTGLAHCFCKASTAVNKTLKTYNIFYLNSDDKAMDITYSFEKRFCTPFRADSS